MDNYFLKIIRNQKGGTALMITMMVLSSILFIVLATSDVVRNGLIASKSQIHSAKAYYAAESGVERILWEMRRNSLFTADPLLSNPCNSGDYFCYDAADYGAISSCDSTCPAPLEFSQQYFSINPPNNVYYEILYETNVAPLVIKSTGIYVDPKDSSNFLRRVIKIYY